MQYQIIKDGEVIGVMEGTEEEIREHLGLPKSPDPEGVTVQPVDES